MSDRERPSERDAPEGEGLLTTGDMARRADSTLRTVRFYEEEGLIKSLSRGAGGQRFFDPSELSKLAFALDLREAGLSVHDIRTLFGLKSGCASPREASQRMAKTLESQIGELQQKIDTLRCLREELAAMVSVLASECERCADPRFRIECDTCNVMNAPASPRALKVLWADVKPKEREE